MSTDPKALERAWRMMEKKGPHYSTCSTMLDLDSLDVVCDCGYVEIHRLVLALPATPAPESPAPEHEPGEHWPGAPASDKSAVEKAFSAGFVAGYSNADDSYPGPDEDVALAAYLAQSPEVGTGSETSPDAGASIREAIEEAVLMMPPCGCQEEMDGTCKVCESCHVGNKLSTALRLLGRRPAERSEAEQIPTPHPVAEAEQSPQPVELLDGGAADRLKDRIALFCKYCGTAGVVGAFIQDWPSVQVTCQPCASMWKIKTTPRTRRLIADRAGQPGLTVGRIADIIYWQTESDRQEANIAAENILKLFRLAQAPTRNAGEAQ